MSSEKTPVQFNKEDVQAMQDWFHSHRTGSYNGVRSFEDYVALIRNAIDNNNLPFLKNAVRFCKGNGGLGFEKILTVSDLNILVAGTK